MSLKQQIEILDYLLKKNPDTTIKDFLQFIAKIISGQITWDGH